MESRDRAYWENRLAQCSSFLERAGVLEELLNFLQEELAKALGDREGEHEEPHKAQHEKDFFELFVEALEALQRREENIIGAPPERRKALGAEVAHDPCALGLQDLLELYGLYLGEGVEERLPLPDTEFAHLLEERRRVILSQCRENLLLPMGHFFSDCKDKKMTIATFLVLLDLVFRNVLFMRQGRNGEILLGWAGPENAAESP
ncbi:hypothetical protein [Candidatus Caldatribacterium saccharofermentans]|uniref:hypothetical protein n=1 Tax=Candidatus Caldatribacterium saccharofermentans TaxID=1454753 RepID=UPI003D03CBD6